MMFFGLKIHLHQIALITIILFIAGCGSGKDKVDETPTVETITLSGKLTTNFPLSQSKIDYRADPLDWSNALIEIIDLSGNVVTTTTASGDGSFSVSVPPGEDYIVRASIGNLVLKAFAPSSTTDQTVIVDPKSSAIVEVLAQISGNPNFGDAGVDVSTAFPAGTIKDTVSEFEHSPLVGVVADAILADIIENFDRNGTSATVGSASSAGDKAAKDIAGAQSDTTPPVTTATPAGGTFNEAISVSLSCSDGFEDGCYKTSTFYTTDSKDTAQVFEIYTSPIELNRNTALTFFSIDIAGNVETSLTETYNFEYSVGGTISGLSSPIVLRNNNEDLNLIGGVTEFTFVTRVADGASYNVSVSGQPEGQECLVANGGGRITGANITNIAVTCVDSSPTSLSVILQQRGATGALKPVSDVRVVYNNPNTGAGIDSVVTDSNGVADFGDIGESTVTITILAPENMENGKNIKRTATFSKLTTDTVLIRFDRLFRPLQPEIATVELSGDTNSFFAYTPSSIIDDSNAMQNVSLYPLDVQADGNISVVAGALGEGLGGCGSTLDNPVPSIGDVWYFTTDTEPALLNFLSIEPIKIPSTFVYRKGAMFTLDNDHYSFGTSGSAYTCADRLPGATYMHQARTQMDFEGPVWVNFTRHYNRWWSIMRLSDSTLPTVDNSLNFEQQDIRFNKLNFADDIISSGIEGIAASDADMAITRLKWDKGSVHYDWLIVSPASGESSNHQLPGLPVNYLDRRNVDQDDHILEQEQVVLNGVSDYAGAANQLVSAQGDLELMLMNSSPTFSAFRWLESQIPYVFFRMDYADWDSQYLGEVISNVPLGSVRLGTTVTLEAKPVPESKFSSWGGDCTIYNGDPPYDDKIEVPLDDVNVTATDCTVRFVPEIDGHYLLVVSKGSIPGLINSEPDGINFDGINSFDAFGSFASGTVVSVCISTVAESVQWGGACSGTNKCSTVTMNSSASCSVSGSL